MKESALVIYERSLSRCNANPDFLDLFYAAFLASSPKVKEKFANTDFVRQKRALIASFYLIVLAVGEEEEGLGQHLRHIAKTHSRGQLDIGAALYDLWLDALLKTVARCDPQYTDKVKVAWEEVMMKGIAYLLEHYHDEPTG